MQFEKAYLVAKVVWISRGSWLFTTKPKFEPISDGFRKTKCKRNKNFNDSTKRKKKKNTTESTERHLPVSCNVCAESTLVSI